MEFKKKRDPKLSIKQMIPSPKQKSLERFEEVDREIDRSYWLQVTQLLQSNLSFRIWSSPCQITGSPEFGYFGV